MYPSWNGTEVKTLIKNISISYPTLALICSLFIDACPSLHGFLLIFPNLNTKFLWKHDERICKTMFLSRSHFDSRHSSLSLQDLLSVSSIKPSSQEQLNPPSVFSHIYFSLLSSSFIPKSGTNQVSLYINLKMLTCWQSCVPSRHSSMSLQVNPFPSRT